MSSAGQRRRRVVRRLALGAALGTLLALVGSVVLAGPASAHASLVGTDPTEGEVLDRAPATATFTFDEPVRLAGGAVHVFDATGTELTSDARAKDDLLVVDLPDGMDQGTFVVAWRVVSADGHPIAGALTFSVGTPSATVAAVATAPTSSPASVKAALGLAQATTYLGVFGAVGLVVFVLFLLPSEGGLDQVRARVRRWASRFAWTATVLGFVTVVLTVMYQNGDGFGALFSQETYDIPAGTELLAYALAVLGTWTAVLGTTRAARVPALAGGLLALVALGLVGHTRAFPPLWVMLTSDLTHVAAGSVWFGGLVGLALSLRRLADRPRIAAVVLGRFSVLAAFLLAGVAVSGSVLGWRILRSWDNLVSSDFGRVLLVKIAVVGLVGLVAAYNRYRLLPAVLADSSHTARGAAGARMQRVVRVEALLLVGVLGLTGFLVDRSPVESSGAVALPGGFDSSTFSGAAAKVKVVATVQPLSVGRNTVLLQVQDPAGNPIEPAAVPVLTASAGGVALGEQELTNVDSGTYAATVVLPRGGTWTFQVSVRLTVFDNPVVSVRVPVPAGR